MKATLLYLFHSTVIHRVRPGGIEIEAMKLLMSILAPGLVWISQTDLWELAEDRDGSKTMETTFGEVKVVNDENRR